MPNLPSNDEITRFDGTQVLSALVYYVTTQVLSALDGEDCGKRYLCELASMKPADLTQEERRTLAIFTVT
jgi:hypothetical protein